MTSSAITREDYAKNPQAVLDVLEFYTDHQKREYEDYGAAPASNAPKPLASSSTSRGYQPSEPTRFEAGTGLAGMRDGGEGGPNALAPKSGPSLAPPRPSIPRQDTASSVGTASQSSRPPIMPQDVGNSPGPLQGRGMPSAPVSAPQANRPAPARPAVNGRTPTPAKKTVPEHAASSTAPSQRSERSGAGERGENQVQGQEPLLEEYTS